MSEQTQIISGGDARPIPQTSLDGIQQLFVLGSIAGLAYAGYAIGNTADDNPETWRVVGAVAGGFIGIVAAPAIWAALEPLLVTLFGGVTP